MSLIPTKSNKPKANRPIDRIPRAHQRQAQGPRSGDAYVLLILLPQPTQLSQHQLEPAKQRKPMYKLSAPVRTQSKSTKPKRNLKKEKEEAIEWLNNLRIYD